MPTPGGKQECLGLSFSKGEGVSGLSQLLPLLGLTRSWQSEVEDAAPYSLAPSPCANKSIAPFREAKLITPARGAEPMLVESHMVWGIMSSLPFSEAIPTGLGYEAGLWPLWVQPDIFTDCV